jgi:hypothetical protein
MESVVQRSMVDAHDEKRSGRVNSSSGKFSSTTFTAPALHQVLTFVAGMSLRSDHEMTLCRTEAANFFDEGMNKPFPQYDTYFNLREDDVEKFIVGANILK